MKKGHNMEGIAQRSRSMRLLASLGMACLFGSAASVPVALAESVDGIAAIVNQDVIMRSELDKRVRQVATQLQQRGIAQPAPEALRQQVLDRLILEDVQLQMAARAHLSVSDEQFNGALQGIAANNHVTVNQFIDSLERQGYRFADVREQIRREMLLSMVQQGSVAGQVRVTDQEIDQYLARMATAQNVEYHLAHILVPLPENPDAEQVAAAQQRIEQLRRAIADGENFQTAAAAASSGNDAFSGGDLGWRRRDDMPTIFSTAVPNMTVGEVSAPIRSASGFHLVKLVDRRGHDVQRHIVQQYKARHILIAPNPIRSQQEALQYAASIKQRILSGEDFTVLAKANSDDHGSALSGGELGWVDADDMVPSFAQVLKTAPEGKLIGPIQSPFGWHLIEVEGRRTQDVTVQFEREQARRAIFQRKAEEDLDGWLQELKAGAYIDNRLYPQDSNGTSPAVAPIQTESQQ